MYRFLRQYLEWNEVNVFVRFITSFGHYFWFHITFLNNVIDLKMERNQMEHSTIQFNVIVHRNFKYRIVVVYGSRYFILLTKNGLVIGYLQHNAL